MTQRRQIEKAIQAAGAILRRSGGPISRLRLVKLLYIADRLAMEKAGSRILGGRVVAMKNGPLHSEVYDLVKGAHICEPQWSGYFRNSGYNVEMINQPDIGKLSRFEIELLNEVVDIHAAMDDWEIVDKTHGFEEWKKHYPNPDENTSRNIPLSDIVDAAGRSSDKDDILQEAKNAANYDYFFANLER